MLPKQLWLFTSPVSDFNVVADQDKKFRTWMRDCLNIWITDCDSCCFFVFYSRSVLEVPTIYWPTAVLEIQHICPERCSCWGVWTQRSTALTHAGRSHNYMHVHTCTITCSFICSALASHRGFIQTKLSSNLVNLGPFRHVLLYFNLMVIYHLSSYHTSTLLIFTLFIHANYMNEPKMQNALCTAW